MNKTSWAAREWERYKREHFIDYRYSVLFNEGFDAAWELLTKESNNELHQNSKVSQTSRERKKLIQANSNHTRRHNEILQPGPERVQTANVEK